MISMLRESARLGLFSMALLAVSPAGAQEPFYKGKRLSLLVNFDAGSATDIDARIFARHFVKHIAGAPSLVVQNMAGAGGVNGALYLGEVAPKDGTTIGFLTAIAWNYASQPEKFRTDFKTYTFVGYTGGTAVYYMRKDVPPGIGRPEDLIKVPALISGGVAAHTGRDISIRLTLDILGVPSRHVTGYRSGERARLALRRNEIQFYADTTPGYRGAVEPTLVKEGTVIPLYFDPHWNGKTFGVSKQVKGLTIQPYQEFYRKVKGKMPSGHLWETYLALITLNGAMQRIIALPPGAPPAAVTALRAALNKLNNDKDFAADATKTLGFVPEYSANAATADEIRNALVVKPEIRKFVPEYIKKGSAKAK
jgi:tripartite-type tricarboxylate transporter receptor subunit TctC